jgi:hypothetical protein
MRKNLAIRRYRYNGIRRLVIAYMYKNRDGKRIAVQIIEIATDNRYATDGRVDGGRSGLKISA